MNPFCLLALLLTLAALSSYVNHRFIGLPTTVALMGISLLLALGLIGVSQLGWPLQEGLNRFLHQVNLSQTLLGGALSFLLFAGALNIEFKEFHVQRWRVASLAFLSTTLSLFLVAGLAWLIFGWLGLHLPLLYCLIFGSLISPTDPIAVLGLLKKANAPLSLETKITGESLFNDGVGLAGFSLFLDSLLDTGPQMDVVWTHAAVLLAREAGGGIALGWVLGWLTIRLIKGVDHYPVEVLLTLALVTGGYALGLAWHVSGPLVVATSGLLVGHYGRSKEAMSEKTRQNLDSFWEMIDEILNALLFVLVGLQVSVVKYQWDYTAAAALMIVAVLFARAVSVGIPATVLRVFGGKTERHGIPLLTWGGLRGAISVALALSLPEGPEHDLILTVTYAVVAFSILVQGTTLPWLLRRLLRPEDKKIAVAVLLAATCLPWTLAAGEPPADWQDVLPPASRHRFAVVDPAWRKTVSFMRLERGSFVTVDHPFDAEKKSLYMETRYFPAAETNTEDAVKIVTCYPDGTKYDEIDRPGDESFCQHYFSGGTLREYTYWKANHWLAGVSINPVTKQETHFSEGEGSLTTYANQSATSSVTLWYHTGDVLLSVERHGSRPVKFELHADESHFSVTEKKEELSLFSQNEIWTLPAGSGAQVQLLGPQVNHDFKLLPVFGHGTFEEKQEEQRIIAEWTTVYGQRRAAFLHQYAETLAAAGRTWQELEIEFIHANNPWSKE